jgi:hypothetical protein
MCVCVCVCVYVHFFWGGEGGGQKEVVPKKETKQWASVCVLFTI